MKSARVAALVLLTCAAAFAQFAPSYLDSHLGVQLSNHALLGVRLFAGVGAVALLVEWLINARQIIAKIPTPKEMMEVVKEEKSTFTNDEVH